MSNTGLVAPPGTPARPWRTIWRDDSSHRVATLTAVAAASGAAYATLRHLPAPLILRATVSCALISSPFFALREVVAAGLAVDGPVASAIAGGVAGYVGALAFSTGSWKAVSHGAMVVGIGAGMLDAVTSGLDLRRRSLLVKWREGVAGNAGPAPRKSTDADIGAVPEHAERGVANGDVGDDGTVNAHHSGGGPDANGDWPVWLPVIKQVEDDEYEHLLQSQKATAAALQKEQARIARLLATIERLKANRDMSSLPTVDQGSVAFVSKGDVGHRKGNGRSGVSSRGGTAGDGGSAATCAKEPRPPPVAAKGP